MRSEVSMRKVLGWAALVLTVLSAAACVFESGENYKGGGRNPPVVKDTSGTPPTPPPTTPPTTPPVPDSAPRPDTSLPLPPTDAALG